MHSPLRCPGNLPPEADSLVEGTCESVRAHLEMPTVVASELTLRSAPQPISPSVTCELQWICMWDDAHAPARQRVQRCKGIMCIVLDTASCSRTFLGEPHQVSRLSLTHRVSGLSLKQEPDWRGQHQKVNSLANWLTSNKSPFSLNS